MWPNSAERGGVRTQVGPSSHITRAVTDHDPGHTAEELEGVDMAGDPVRQLLGGKASA